MDVKHFAATLAKAAADARIVGIIGFAQADSGTFAQISSPDARNQAIDAAYETTKGGVLVWFLQHGREGRITNTLEGTPMMIIEATATCWQQFIMACAENGNFNGTVSGIEPNDEEWCTEPELTSS